jgi:hypothetical protein
MDPELERVLEGLKKAAEFVKTYRFELTEDYLTRQPRVRHRPRRACHASAATVVTHPFLPLRERLTNAPCNTS